jgi:hypothetical protein
MILTIFAPLILPVFAAACVVLAFALLLEIVKHAHVYTLLKVAGILYLISAILFFIEMIIYVAFQE